MNHGTRGQVGLWIAIIVVLALAVFVAWRWLGGAQQPPSNSQMANPASVHCVDTLHGDLQIVDTAAGQVGYCHLPDGRVCEEWDLLRSGTCTPPSGSEAGTQDTATSTATGTPVTN